MKHKYITRLPLLLSAALAALLTGCAPGDFFHNPASPASIEPASESTGSSEELPVITVDESSNPSAPGSKENETDSDSVSVNSFHGYLLSEEELQDPYVICKETALEGAATLLFTGDVALDDNWSNMTALRSRANGIYDTLSPELMETLNRADICMINNEFPYSDRGTPTPGKKFTFRADPSRVEILKQMGVDIVSLANNHAYDFGPDALLDTFDTLESADIPYVGAGRRLSEAMQPVYFIAGGQKIAYVSATQIERYDPADTKEATEDSPGVLRTLNPGKFLTVIENASQNSDFVVVYVHWGSENTYEVEAAQRELASAYVEAGADLIIGDHSHCLQGFEYVDGIPVIYSLGNFWFNSKNLDTGMVQAVISEGKLQTLQFLPCLQHDCRTDLLLPGTDGSYERVLGVMAGLSTDISIDANGFVSTPAGSGIAPVSPRPLSKPAVSQNTVLPEAPAAPEIPADPAAVPVVP